MRSFISAIVPTFDSSNNKDQKLAGSAQSRSTSAGSSTAPSSAEDRFLGASTIPALQRGGKEEIPDYDYPVPFTVKNTFIDDIDMWRPSSLDGFFQERQIQSCVSRINAPLDSEPIKGPHTLAAAAVPTNDTRAYSMPAVNNYCSNVGIIEGPEFFDALDSLPDAEKPMWQEPLQFADFRCADQFRWQQPLQLVNFFGEQSMGQLPQQVQYPLLSTALPPPPPPAHAPVLGPELQAFVVPPPPQAPVLRISEALPEPEVGSTELPTKGSVGHRLGTCKPCAFFHTKGCAAGPECEFCHLCDAGARKQKRKQKLALIRQARVSN